MRISIAVEQRQPVTGEVRVDGGAPQAFVGLLQMLRILSELLVPGDGVAHDLPAVREPPTPTSR